MKVTPKRILHSGNKEFVPGVLYDSSEVPAILEGRFVVVEAPKERKTRKKKSKEQE